MKIEKFNTDLLAARNYWTEAQVSELPTIKKVGYVALSALAAVSKMFFNLFLYPINGIIHVYSNLQSKPKRLRRLHLSSLAKKTVDIGTDPISESKQNNKSSLLSYLPMNTTLRKKKDTPHRESSSQKRMPTKKTRILQRSLQFSKQKTAINKLGFIPPIRTAPKPPSNKGTPGPQTTTSQSFFPYLKTLANRTIVAPITSGTSYVTGKLSNTKASTVKALKVTQSAITSSTTYITSTITSGFSTTKSAVITTTKVAQSILTFFPRKLYSAGSALFS